MLKYYETTRTQHSWAIQVFLTDDPILHSISNILANCVILYHLVISMCKWCAACFAVVLSIVSCIVCNRMLK